MAKLFAWWKMRQKENTISKMPMAFNVDEWFCGSLSGCESSAGVTLSLALIQNILHITKRPDSSWRDFIKLLYWIAIYY